MIEIGLANIKKIYGGFTVLENVTFDVQTNERVGLIGVNGCGKTTILKLITGIEKQDNGFISIRKGASIGYLEQETQLYSEKTTLEVIEIAFDEIIQIRQKLKEMEQLLEKTQNGNYEKFVADYGKLQQRYEMLEGYTFEYKIDAICSGLKISNEMKEQKFETLSGGEKTRALLAKILLENADVLLLDEPTNHLDIDSVEWLETFLSDYKGAVLIVSHDRYFLDKVVNRIMEIEWGKANLYAGNYSFYIEEKERRFKQEYENYRTVQKKIKAMKAAAERYRIWGRINTDNNAHMARAKRLEAKIEELQQISKPMVSKKIKANIHENSRSGKIALVMDKVSKSFADNRILQKASLQINYGEKTALIGANGSGKTTIFEMITGKQSIDFGDIKIGSNVKPGYLEQEVEFEEANKSVLDTFLTQFPMHQGEARSKLAKFLFTGDEVFKQVEQLSGGEKIRLKLSMMLETEINFLLLDEPTNHLDIDSKEMMEELLQEFQGTVIFVSHDRYFINKIATEIVELTENKLIKYEGNYHYYEECKKKKATLREESAKMRKEIPKATENEVDFRKIENKIKKIEEQITWHEQELDVKNEIMKTCGSDYEKLLCLHQEKDELSEQIRFLYQEWEHLQEKMQ
jgi:ATPase subunit of ABC transporter with duplicated ATPase domains